MKKNLLIAAFSASTLFSLAQDAKEIMKKAYTACQSVKNGYYDMTKYMKYMSSKDTTKSSFTCHFKKLKNDSLYASAFHYTVTYRDNESNEIMYTGEDFVTVSPKDKSGTVMSKTKWASDIKRYSHNYTFYSPFTNKESYPLPHDSDFTDKKQVFKFIGEEKLKGVTCFHVQLNEFPENSLTDEIKTLSLERNFWINKENFIPLQYSIAYKFFMDNDTMKQYEKQVLNKYELNKLTDTTVLTLRSVPNTYKLTDYTPYEPPKLLPNDTIAPNWELVSLTDSKLCLKDLKGQLVLIDFFYKACYPCMQALPVLQELSEKYKNKGLKIVGIDPYDKKEEGIAAFLSKRGVTYTVLLGGNETAKTYRISGYPTIYLVDKTGKIIFSQVGYGKDTESVLEDIIKKNL